MATEAEVANLAAATIGTETRLISLDDDSHVARTLKSVWAAERQATIREGMFNFTTRRSSLAAEAGVDPGKIYPWAFRYPLPANCLRFVELLGAIAKDQYEIENGAILCSVRGPLYIKFLIDVAEPVYWDASFARAFAFKLALSVGHRIAGSAFDSAGAQAKYDEAIGKAARIDGTENPPIEQEDGSWITARYGNGLYRRPGWEMS